MQQFEQMLPVSTNIKDAYNNGMDAEQQFIQVTMMRHLINFNNKSVKLDKPRSNRIKNYYDENGSANYQF